MSTIIFDFDGTIADSFEYVSDYLALQSGLGTLTANQKQQLHGLSMPAMARTLGYHSWQLPWLFLRGRQKMKQGIKSLAPFKDIPEVIRTLHAEGHSLYILSSNSTRNISSFLRANDLQAYFIKIYGGVGLFGKAPALRRLVREYAVPMHEAVYIGDELRDVEAAQSIGLPVIAVTWGFANPDHLRAKKPIAVVTNQLELVDIINARYKNKH